jgi:hypothetical protein
VTKFDCPACGRWIGSRTVGDTLRLARHTFTGEMPSAWLRPGERCPGSLVDVDLLDCEPIDVHGTGAYTVEQWLDFYFHCDRQARGSVSGGGDGEWAQYPRNRYAQYLKALHAPPSTLKVAAGSMPRTANGKFTVAAAGTFAGPITVTVL